MTEKEIIAVYSLGQCGGPAFPVAWDDAGERVAVTGMSLRDYFAAEAMNAYIVRIGVGLADDEVEKLTSDAYRVADAMLEARKR